MKFPLDKNQTNAVTAEDRNTLIVAAPGAGKTTVIINRLNYLIREKNVDIKNIIVITFTKAAAINMKERFIKIVKSESSPFFSTFHGLFYRILRNYIEINIIESKDTYRILQRYLKKYMDEVSEEKIKEVINGISLVKSSRIQPFEADITIDKEIFTEIFNHYEEYKREKNLMDFDDLQVKILEFLTSNEKILNGYRKLFKYILVDEFQDCDDLQLKILKLLNMDNFIYAVGDEDQCIYGFRGSKPEAMVDFNNIFNDAKKIYLDINYRSNKNIIETSKNLIAKNKMRNDKKIKSFKETDGEISVVSTFDERKQGENIAENIKKIMAVKDYKYNDFAILYRTNKESMAIIDVFLRYNIPFVILDSEYNFFEHFISKDILAYLKLAIDSSDKHSLAQILNKPFRYFGKQIVSRLREHNYTEDIFDVLKSYKELKPYHLKNLDKLKRDIQRLNNMSLSGAIHSIIYDLNYGEYLNDYASKFKINYQELMDIVDEISEIMKDKKTIRDLISYVREYSKTLEENKKNKNIGDNKVLLSTIHGVKGMEFKNVFIINVVEENIPHMNSKGGDGIEEERRLFYVAITRAIDNLTVYTPLSTKGKPREKSIFIDECGITKNINLYLPFKKGDKVFHKSFGKGTIIAMDIDMTKVIFDKKGEKALNTQILIKNNLLMGKAYS